MKFNEDINHTESIEPPLGASILDSNDDLFKKIESSLINLNKDGHLLFNR